MASISFDRFDAGLLLARPSSVAPANSLSAVRNMDVQPGGWLRSRPKAKPVSGGLEIGPQWKGLKANGGYLWTFSCWNVASSGKTSDIVNADTGDRIVYAFYSSGAGGDFADASRARLLGATRWENGFLAVVSPDAGVTNYPVLFSVNTATHTATGTLVTDVNCPKSGKMVTASERIYAISDDGLTVRFCKVGGPTDWTLAGDAGFLSVSRHFGSGQRAYGLGLYQDKLAVFSDQSIQLWNIDPDPTAMALDRVVDGVGTRHHDSIVSLNGDLMFLSETGVRSLTTLSNALFPTDVDMGLPIKAMTPSPAALTRFSLGSYEPSAIALAAVPFGQYWVSAPGSWSR
jgi:hypothetical protein